MIETLLGSVLGFGTSIFPAVLDFFQDSKDKKHELAVGEQQLKLMDKQSELNIQEARVTGEMRNIELELEAEKASVEAAHKPQQMTGVGWVDAIRGLVRPLVTFWFMALYSYAKYVTYTQGGDVWTSQDWAIFATIVSFWFGDRVRKYMEQRHANK